MEKNGEISIKSVLYKLTNRPIAMDGEKYVYFDNRSGDLEEVSDELLKEAERIAKEESEKLFEETRVLEINNKTSEIIYNKYTREQQFNISNLLYPYTEEDKEYMFMFIEIARMISREAKDSGIIADEIDWLEIDKRIALRKAGE